MAYKGLPEYKDWHNIQRCGVRHAAHASMKKGIDRILSFDYMGSAEFEFGALAKAWKQLREQGAASKLVLRETPFKSRLEKPFWVIAPADMPEDHLFDAIYGSGTDLYDTRESTYMEYWLSRNLCEHHNKITGWLSIGKQPVFWTVLEDLAHRVFAEVTIKLGVDPSSLSMFDDITFEHADRTWEAQVKGIYETHVRVRRKDGGEQNVPYTTIWSKHVIPVAIEN